jgi:glycerol kinase
MGFAQREFAQHFPQSGWVEHDPYEIWRSQLDVAQNALRNGHVSASDVVAIGITNQRETTILWDRASGAPVGNAIVWQDRRTAPMCEALRSHGVEDVVRAQTGLVLDPYFSATKIAWLLDNVDGLRTRAEAGEIAFGTVDTWLIWNLTGGAHHLTDVTNASRTMLFDIHRLRWSRARCCRTYCRVPPISGRRGSSTSAGRSASPEWPAISRPRSSVNPASHPGWRRTPTAPDRSSC